MNNLNDNLKKALNLFNSKKYDDAKLFIFDLIKNSKVDKKVYFLLYEIFTKQSDSQNAKYYLKKFLELDNKNYIGFNNLANIYLKERKTDKAEKLYLKAVELKSDYLTGIINLAVFYQGMGNNKKAKKFYQKGLSLAPKKLGIYYNLNKIDKDFIGEEKIKYILELLKSEKLEPFDMASGYFLLAEDQKKKKNIIKEVEHLKTAHKHAFQHNLNYNKQLLYYWINIVPRKYDKLSFINSDKIKNELIDLEPIFIIGLPRSGSTIVESILSSGISKIIGLGETNIINWSIINSNRQILEEQESVILDIGAISNKLLIGLKNLNILKKQNIIFTDKSLENFFYIDVILKIFPKAKFINTFRNTEDNVYAIFQQFLGNIAWTHSFENILNYVDNYLKVINFFKKKYPDKIFSLNLEELTNNPEAVSKKMYNFCNLKWSIKALGFYNRKDLFSDTASNTQIRKKIEKYDTKKYKPYKELLKNFSHKYQWINKR
tara:strand:- start:93 stop:1559 length:1467 start_codon:yes stop_codon:yes gene_type:complete